MLLFFLEVGEGEQFLASKILNTLRRLTNLRNIILILLVYVSPYKAEAKLDLDFGPRWGKLFFWSVRYGSDFFHIKTKDQIFLEVCSNSSKLR